MSYGNSFTDNISGTYNFSISGVFNGSVSTHADGTGTLLLPGGLTLNNVLRVKSVQTINLFWGILPFGTARQTVYNFFHASQKFPVLNMTYSSLSITGSTTPSVSAVVTGNSKTIIVGLNEHIKALSSVQLYPNPVKDFIFIESNELKGEVLVEIMDSNGGLVLSTKRFLNATTSESVSLRGLANGFYFAKIQSGTNQILKKFIVQD